MQDHQHTNVEPQPANASKAEMHTPRRREVTTSGQIKPRTMDRGELFRSWAYPQQH
jgi:hypothetical protein